jgi:beta-galactosidase/beta-glucuronidase
MAEKFEIIVGDVSDMEARVSVRYDGQASDITLCGTLRGPFCKNARTLPAEIIFSQSNNAAKAQTEAVITDPCMWTPELPNVYEVNVEARQGKRVIDTYHGTIGLRRMAPRRPADFAPGTG